MPIVKPFDPASVVEVPPEPKPVYDDVRFMNPDQDVYVTYEQACAIVRACFDPSLKVEKAEIPTSTQGYSNEDQPGEFRYNALWTNGFRNNVPAMGTLFDSRGVRVGLKRIYDEMKVVGYKVPDWVYDKVR